MSGFVPTFASDLLLTRVQHAVGEAVLSNGCSGRYRHPPKRLGGDHGVLVVHAAPRRASSPG
jgi:hypothetical protein